MTEEHSVISAFLDDEPFDAGELAAALSEPDGRALLIDLVALRHIVQPDDAEASALVGRRAPGGVRPLIAAAAVLMALAGGYFIADRRGPIDPLDPPAPARVVEADAWQTIPTGGGR